MKRRQLGVLLLLLFTCTISLCQSLTKIDDLRIRLEGYIKEHKIPGLSFSIVKADTIIFSGGVGYAHVEKKEKVTNEYLFRQGSISKSFTALGLVYLLNEFSLNLNSPIRDIDSNIPFTNKWEEKHPVLISHLLEHTSGFDEFHAHAIYNNKDQFLPPVINMVHDHRKSLITRWQPGTKKSYSNPNYIVAGHLIEVISGLSFNDYIKENILEKLGMSSSGYYFNQPKDKLFAQGYQRTGSTLNPIPFAKINGSPAGGFCANADDMAKYLQFMLKRDTLLFEASMFDRIEKPQSSIAARKGLRFGYGLGNYMIWKNGYLFHGHGGQIDGFASRYVYSREADLGVSIAINRNGNANAIVNEILNFILDDSSRISEGRKTYPVPDTLKSKFTGFYEFKSPRNELLGFTDKMFGGFKVEFENEMLVRRRLLGRPKDTLYYAGNNQFYFNNEGVPSAMLIDIEDGKPGFWINDNYTEQESRLKRLSLFFGLLISFLLIGINSLYSIISVVANFFRKKKKTIINHLALAGFGLNLVLMFIGFGFTMSNTTDAMNINLSSLLFYFASFGLVLFSLILVYRCFKLSQHKRRYQFFYILTCFGSVFITCYLWNIGFIGLQLWNY